MSDGILSDDLLNMKLHDVSDLLLKRYCETGNNVLLELPGVDEQGERFVLRLYFYKEEVKDE